MVELLHADVAALADVGEDLSPDGAQERVHLFAVGFAHLLQEIGFHGALEAVVGAAHNLHLDVEFVEQTLVEHDLGGHAVKVEHALGVEEDFVGDGSDVIGSLAVVFAIGDDELA